MKLTGETKFFIGIILATFVIVGAGLLLFTKPQASFSRDELIPAGTATRGSQNAKTSLVEFSDFQCPACGSFKPIVDGILAKYQDTLYFGYRHFPLINLHQYAFNASLAAYAAGQQGKFWEMYEYLFANQERLSNEIIREGAQKIGLDMAKYEVAVKAEESKNAIQKDLDAGAKFGVDSTPTFFLNGKKLELFSKGDLEKSVQQAISE